MTTLEWLQSEGYPEVMPMTIDNLAIIIDRHGEYWKQRLEAEENVWQAGGKELAFKKLLEQFNKADKQIKDDALEKLQLIEEIEKLQAGNKILINALQDIKNWTEELEHEWGDPGARAINALNKYWKHIK
jgi:hypothetical protein